MKIPLVFALVGTLASISLAQDTTTKAPTLDPAPQQERTYQVPIRNVKASVMAWWIDPQNHERPEFPTMPASPLTAGQEKLPEGVTRIVAVDPQNSLLVFATPDGAVRIANTIRTLDRPLQQVEIEANFVQVNSDALPDLGVNFTTATSPTRMSRVTGNIQGKLTELLKAKKAIIITAPRITTYNRTKTPFPVSSMRPATWNVNKGFKEERFEKLSAVTGLQVTDTQAWRLTPTLNADETITLETEGEQTVQLQGGQDRNGALVLERQQLPQLAVNLRDGETIAIEKKALPSQQTNANTKTIVLLTARIIRRIEGDK